MKNYDTLKDFYSKIEQEASIPDIALTEKNAHNAVFRGMVIDLAEIKNQISKSEVAPRTVTIYADVLFIQQPIEWNLTETSLIIYAREIEIYENCIIDFSSGKQRNLSFLVFCQEISGNLNIKASATQSFTLNNDNIAPGFCFNFRGEKVIDKPLTFSEGLPMSGDKKLNIYIQNLFVYASVLYDTDASLALSMLKWIKSWAKENEENAILFYRSVMLSSLLQAEINASQNNARFVPYLSSKIYTDLTEEIVKEVAITEQNYLQLFSLESLSCQNIDMVQTMMKISENEQCYIEQLLKQAYNDYENAIESVRRAKSNIQDHNLELIKSKANFEEIGLPGYQRSQIIESVISLVAACGTFTLGIVSLTSGNPTGGTSSVNGAINGMKKASELIEVGAKINEEEVSIDLTKSVKSGVDTMQKLRELTIAIDKMYITANKLVKLVRVIDVTGEQMDTIKQIDSVCNLEKNTLSEWDIFKLQINSTMSTLISLGVDYASDYKRDLEIMAVHCQSLNMAQLAVIQTSQHLASISLQLQYAKEKEKYLKEIIADWENDKESNQIIMQLLCQKYLDIKGLIYTTLKLYNASYFYWALQPSNIIPSIIGDINSFESGLSNITKMKMDTENALMRFSPPPQELKNIFIEITDSKNLDLFKSHGELVLDITSDQAELKNIERVRLHTFRVWIEGLHFKNITSKNVVDIVINNSGNYKDRYKNVDYKFMGKPLSRSFRYTISSQKIKHDYRFNDGSLGIIQLDGCVDQEVFDAYFQPTPFSEWKICLLNKESIDYSKISKIVIQLAGSAIGHI